MPDYFETDPIGSERLLGKVMTGGRRIKHRRRLITRGGVAGFVTVVAAGGALGATQSGGSPQPANSRVGGNAPQFVQLYPVRTVASSHLPGHGPGNVDDGDTTTFWAADARIPISVRVPATKEVIVKSRGGRKHRTRVRFFYFRLGMSAPGVGSWIKLIYSHPEEISSVSIIPGDQFPPSDFGKCGHPKNVELLFSSGHPVFFTVPSSPNFFQQTFFPPRDSNFLEVKVLSTYSAQGTGQFDAVTELAAYVNDAWSPTTTVPGTTGSTGTTTSVPQTTLPPSTTTSSLATG